MVIIKPLKYGLWECDILFEYYFNQRYQRWSWKLYSVLNLYNAHNVYFYFLCLKGKISILHGYPTVTKEQRGFDYFLAYGHRYNILKWMNGTMITIINKWSRDLDIFEFLGKWI